jgi:hypothetical protein
MLPLINLVQPPPCKSKGQVMLLLKAMYPLFKNHHRVGVVVAPEAQELSVP